MFLLSPEELFFLGKHLKAKYIDYDYIRLAGELQHNYMLKERESISGLVGRKIISEDFSGNLYLDPTIADVLKPVFFGEFEVEILLIQKERKTPDIYKFHFMEHQVTTIRVCGQDLYMFQDGNQQSKLLKEKIFIHGSSDYGKVVPIKDLNVINSSRIVNAQNILVGKVMMSSQILELNGVWYMRKDDVNAVSMSNDDLENWWKRMMEGDRNGVL